MGNVISAFYLWSNTLILKTGPSSPGSIIKTNQKHVGYSWFFPWSKCFIFWKFTKPCPFLYVVYSMHIVLYNTYTYTSMHTYARAQRKHTHTYKKRWTRSLDFEENHQMVLISQGWGLLNSSTAPVKLKAPVWSLAELTLALNRTAFPRVESHKCLWISYFNNTLHLYLSTPLLPVWRIRAGYLIVFLFYGQGDGFSLQVPNRNQGLGLVSRTLAAVICCEVMGQSTASLTFPLLFLSGKYCL